MNGLKKPGVHGAGAAQRVTGIDGQQQEEMTGEGLWQGELCGVGQGCHGHFNALHSTEGHTVRARQEHWRHMNKGDNNCQQPDV